MPLRRSLQEQKPGRVLQPKTLGADHQDPAVPACLNAARPRDTHTHSRPLLLHRATKVPGRGLPEVPFSFGSGGPLRTPSPPGTAAAAASAQAHTAAVTLLFFFPLSCPPFSII